jgi:hypothetical protein
MGCSREKCNMERPQYAAGNGISPTNVGPPGLTAEDQKHLDEMEKKMQVLRD